MLLRPVLYTRRWPAPPPQVPHALDGNWKRAPASDPHMRRCRVKAMKSSQSAESSSSWTKKILSPSLCGSTRFLNVPDVPRSRWDNALRHMQSSMDVPSAVSTPGRAKVKDLGFCDP